LAKRQYLYDVFLSYPRKHSERARETVEILESAGLRVFWDKHIKAGQDWAEVVDNAIYRSERFFVLWCCDASDSEFVMWEIEFARNQQKPLIAHRICSFPVPQFLSRRQWVNCIDPAHSCSHLDITSKFEGAPSDFSAALLPHPGHALQSLVETSCRRVSAVPTELNVNDYSTHAQLFASTILLQVLNVPVSKDPDESAD
jgi:hypothetical protein